MNPGVRSNRGRILVGKVGLDGHDRGAKVLARMLAEDGFEVEYLGVRTTPGQLADAALEKRADVVAISLLSGAHVELSAAVRKALDGHGLRHVPVVVGGLIPKADVETLQAVGAARVFTRGQSDSGSERIFGAMDELVSLSRQTVPAGQE